MATCVECGGKIYLTKFGPVHHFPQTHAAVTEAELWKSFLDTIRSDINDRAKRGSSRGGFVGDLHIGNPDTGFDEQC
jgi:hypothetical protein